MASSTASSDSFLEKNKGFVLKLKLVGLGAAPQIRRVRLKNIVAKNGNGGVSYDELVSLAIGYTFPNPTEQLEVDDFEVTLTYYDVDNDCVTLATTDELMDAIEQYADAAGKGTLRLTTDVRRKKTKSSKKVEKSAKPVSATSSRISSFSTASSSSSSSPSPTSDPFTTPAQEGTTPTPTSRGQNPTQAQFQFHAILESFVSILAAAVVALQSLSPPPPTPPRTNELPNEQVTEPAAPSAPVESTTMSREAVPASDVLQATEPVVVPEVLELAVESPQEQVSEQPAPEVAESNPDATADATTSSPPPEEERPFIHGRHTCDGCLSTPIVGLRFHATNLKDYDLCERCKENYKGTEIQFEPAELDRDRPFQERWHRRRSKWSHFGNRCRPHHGPGMHHAHGHRGHPFCPPMGAPPLPPPFGRPPPFGPPHLGPHGHMPPPPHPIGHDGLDEALKEAIRRSLDEMKGKAETLRETVLTEPKPELLEPTAPVEDEIISEVAAPALQEPALEPTISVEEPAEVLSVPSEETPQPDDEALMDFKGKDVLIQVETQPTMDEDSKPGEDEIVVTTVDVDSESSDEADDGPESEIVVQKEDGMEVDEDGDNFPSLEEPSFSSDAAGNGDVAVALGQTLDQCASMIDAFVTELKRAESRSSSREEDYDSDFQSARQESGSGETILEAVDDDTKQAHPKDDEKSDDGWQVVTETQQIADDEILARAAQVIGSALFNSDVSRSGISSTLSGSNGSALTEFSLPTVPSVVPSLAEEGSQIPMAQLHRFAVQLKQLRELGFNDDSASIDILERLTAANVGADLFEEVSVTQVVNELLNRMNG